MAPIKKGTDGPKASKRARSETSSPPTAPPLLRDDTCAHKFSTILALPAVPGRSVFLNDFTLFDLPQLFDKMGWTQFVKMTNPWSRRIAALFYANMIPNSKKGKIKSLVKGVEVEIDENVISEVLHLPVDGLKIYGMEIKDLGWKPEAVFKTLAGEKYVKGFDPKITRDLIPVARLIHHISETNFAPKGGHYTRVYSTGLILAYACIRGVKVNVPHLILNTMMDVSDQMPYGVILASILSKLGVDVSGEASEPPLKPIDRTTGKKMGIFPKEGENIAPIVFAEDVEGAAGGVEGDVVWLLKALEGTIKEHSALLRSLHSKVDSLHVKLDEVISFLRGNPPHTPRILSSSRAKTTWPQSSSGNDRAEDKT